jgi:restriction endonuclease Mrr
MAIPDYQTILLPLLRFLSGGEERNIGDVVKKP